MIEQRQIPVVDLFAGAGGFGLATRNAGCDLRLSIELDKVASATMRKNLESSNHEVLEKDVREVTGDEVRSRARLSKSDPLVIVGGPPCQPFSKASYWTDPGLDAAYRRARGKGEKVERPQPVTNAKKDERRLLLDDFLRIVIESGADGFVMENVRSLTHPRNLGTFERFVEAFSMAGYSCTVASVDATSYGVPQKRQRVFVMGSRGKQPEVPQPTHSKNQADGLPPPVSVGKVLDRFKSPKYYEDGEEVVGRWAEQLREIPPGWNYKYLTAWANHPNPVFEAETRFWNFLLKLRPDAPSWTINANPGPWVGPFHWTSRRLRTCELAAIQTFPEGYSFLGSRREMIRQIGNAVPPKLAEKIVQAVARTL